MINGFKHYYYYRYCLQLVKGGNYYYPNYYCGRSKKYLIATRNEKCRLINSRDRENEKSRKINLPLVIRGCNWYRVTTKREKEKTRKKYRYYSTNNKFLNTKQFTKVIFTRHFDKSIIYFRIASIGRRYHLHHYFPFRLPSRPHRFVFPFPFDTRHKLISFENENRLIPNVLETELSRDNLREQSSPEFIRCELSLWTSSKRRSKDLPSTEGNNFDKRSIT